MGIYPTTSVLNQAQLPGEFLVSEAPGHRSRESRYLEMGQNLIGGTILGLLTAANGVQVVTISGSPTGGTFILKDENGDETTALAYNASAATVQAALQALPSIGAGNATVTGSAGGPYTVTSPNDTVVFTLSAISSLTGGTNPSIAVTTTDTGGVATVGALNLGNSDGSQTATDILYANTNATSAPQQCVTIARDAEVNQAEIFYPAGATAAQILAINEALATNSGIVVRPAV